jgi:hypothetical protein
LLKTIERRSSSSSSFVTVYCSRTARKPMDRERNRVVRQQRKGDMKKRAVGYEDPAKPVWVSAPFIAVAATTAFLIAGHLLSRRPGVQLSPFHLNPKSLRPKLIEKFADQKRKKMREAPDFWFFFPISAFLFSDILRRVFVCRQVSRWRWRRQKSRRRGNQ